MNFGVREGNFRCQKFEGKKIESNTNLVQKKVKIVELCLLRVY